MDEKMFEGKSREYRQGFIMGLLAVATNMQMHALALMMGETPKSLREVALTKLEEPVDDSKVGFADGIETGCTRIQQLIQEREQSQRGGNEAYERWLATA